MIIGLATHIQSLIQGIAYFPFIFLFDISDFVSDQALSLVGVSWFIAKPDEFTRYKSVTSGGNVTSLRLCYALSGLVRHPAGTDDLSHVSSSL